MKSPEQAQGQENDFEGFKNWLRKDYDNQLSQLGLTIEDIRGKRILEIGAYDRRFAAACQLFGVTEDVYSVEPSLDGSVKEGYAEQHDAMEIVDKLPAEIREKIDQKTLITDAEHIPLEDQAVDIVLGRRVPWFGVEQLTDRIKEGLRIASEVRLYPVTQEMEVEFTQALSAIKRDIPGVEVEYCTTTVNPK
ncbi:MAG: hypothetical protein G01um101448_604 [Parcubacteria group bacterium Gr01-1014_48]|nr:MAG: hypothetical protein G01um101448_604 [Parcubacteria group bacterium Gr01-1014_48]